MLEGLAEHSATWVAVSEWAADEIKKSALALEARDLSPDNTQFLRGYIAALRQVLALTQSPKLTVIASSTV